MEFRTEKRTIYHKRITYLKGKLEAKYWADFDEIKSDNKEQHFNINVYEAVLNVNEIRPYTEPTFDEYENIETFLTNLPNPITCKITKDGNVKYYELKLQGRRYDNIELSQVVKDEDKSFGTIHADIYGYVVHEEPEEITVEIPIFETTSQTTTNIITPTTNNERYFEPPVKKPPTYFPPNTPQEGCFSIFFQLLGWVFMLFIVGYYIAIIISIIALLKWWSLVLLGIFLCLYFYDFIPSIIKTGFGWIFRIIPWLFIIAFVVGLYNIVNDNSYYPKPYTPKDNSLEKTDTNKIENSNTNRPDSIISHFRIWQNYEGDTFKGYLSILVSDLYSSINFKQNLPSDFSNYYEYAKDCNAIYFSDQIKLHFIYAMFDSIKSKNNLSENKFAELMVSCIQDIPYTLILDDDCDSPKNYMLYGRKNYNCEGFVKFGMNTPIEFMDKLLGDCDTRTLFLFTVLTHYNYDVVMLASNEYNHSIIGINLPYDGTYKTFEGKRYYVWETTSVGFIPGKLPTELSDMNNWNVILPFKQLNQ